MVWPRLSHLVVAPETGSKHDVVTPTPEEPVVTLQAVAELDLVMARATLSNRWS